MKIPTLDDISNYGVGIAREEYDTSMKIELSTTAVRRKWEHTTGRMHPPALAWWVGGTAPQHITKGELSRSNGDVKDSRICHVQPNAINCHGREA